MLFVWSARRARGGSEGRREGRSVLKDVGNLVDDEDREAVDVGEAFEAVPDLPKFFRARDEASAGLVVRAAKEGAD